MREFFGSLLHRTLEQPVQFIVKPAIKSVVVIGLLSVAAQTLYERSVDRQGLAKLASAAAKGSLAKRSPPR
jgi:phage baseplate assembly protein W